jgi:hypothetical protein
MAVPIRGTVLWDARSDTSIRRSDESCETFFESYARGDIDVGGPEPPEHAKRTVVPDELGGGDFPAPAPPDETQRVRELCVL